MIQQNILMTMFFYISNYIVREFLDNVKYNEIYFFQTFCNYYINCYKIILIF